MKLVTCVDEGKLKTALPSNALNFPPVKEVVLPGYETQAIGFPSMLNMMRKIIQEQPDQIIISTPGPLGLGAMLCAKLMDLPIKTIYHTDFAEQIMRMSGEPMLANLADHCVNAFYKLSDRVFVPSKSYIDKLTHAGLNKSKLSIFPRGLDLTLYRPNDKPEQLIRRHQLHGSFTLLFAGRISEDKNLRLLSKLFIKANQEQPGLYNLVIAGDGPDLGDLKERLAAQSNVYFTGRLSPEELVNWYQCVDLLVFPSHTDTFGMVVLEAQACGVPCLVTATGGPKEIIQAGVTGDVVYTDFVDDWLATVGKYQMLKTARPDDWQQLRHNCVDHVNKLNDWQPVFDRVLGNACLLPKPKIGKINPDPSPDTPDSKPQPSNQAA